MSWTSKSHDFCNIVNSQMYSRVSHEITNHDGFENRWSGMMLWAFCTQDEGWQRLLGDLSLGSQKTPKMYIAENIGNFKKLKKLDPHYFSILEGSNFFNFSQFLLISEICNFGVILDPWLRSPGSVCQPSSWVQNAHNTYFQSHHDLWFHVTP